MRRGWSSISPAPAQWVLGLDHKGVSWYQRQEPAPALESGERLWLCCESAATDAEFWVNGRSIGRNVGDYIPFRFEVPREVVSGTLNIVGVDQIHVPAPAPGVLVQNGHITKGFHDVLSVQHAGLWGRVAMCVTGPAAIRPAGCASSPTRTGEKCVSWWNWPTRGPRRCARESRTPDGHEVATLEGDVASGATSLELSGVRRFGVSVEPATSLCCITRALR